MMRIAAAVIATLLLAAPALPQEVGDVAGEARDVGCLDPARMGDVDIDDRLDPPRAR